MLLVKIGTITTHLKLDTWKEPGQKKHIKDPAKHDFKKGTAQMWVSGKQPVLVPELKHWVGRPLSNQKSPRTVSPQIVFITNFQRFTWQRFPFY